MVDCKLKKMGVIFLIFLLFFMINFIDSTKSQPVIMDVNIYPSSPIPFENVTISVGLNNSSYDSVDEIRLIYQEYMDDVSFHETYNISLRYSYSCCMTFYERTFKLIQSNATIIKYHLEILSNGTWYKYNTSYFHLYSNPDGKIINNEENQMPGFEFIFLIFSVILFLITRHYKLKDQNK
ncbi:MAG: hypothetical protein BV457_06530 [Thermoplasmata archaeon M9B1D]|nr:MAG: hypothetical protein BV457_06530 [Thermoplasmata archaeon M9B1D]PNX51538.1 MAG: hypothetical protein BV456_02770 [Thermoplasmata archaeon M8B2D]